MTLGEKIKELRIAHNESLQQLADEIGISKAHLWELERNNSQNIEKYSTTFQSVYRCLGR